MTFVLKLGGNYIQGMVKNKVVYGSEILSLRCCLSCLRLVASTHMLSVKSYFIFLALSIIWLYNGRWFEKRSVMALSNLYLHILFTFRCRY